MDDQVKETVVESNESAQAIGFVTSTEGATIVVISADGSIRELNPGDPLHEGDVLQVTDGAHVVLTFADGSVRQLSSGESFQLSQGNFSELALSDSEGENPEFADLLASLEAGEDISEDQEATAAGEEGGGGNEIGQGLKFALTGLEVTPTAGIDPNYDPRPFPEPTSDPDLAVIGGNSPVVITGDVDANTTGAQILVDEDDLPGGSDGSDSTTVTRTGSIFAPDGVDDLIVDGNFVIENGVFTATSFTTSGLGNTFTAISYTPNSTGGLINYSYTLDSNETHPTGDGENSVFETLAVSLTDTDGDLATASLDIQVVDDLRRYC
jgi:hypothetical protein